MCSLLLAGPKLKEIYQIAKQEIKKSKNSNVLSEKIKGYGKNQEISIAELQLEQTFLISQLKQVFHIFWWLFNAPIALLRMALIFRFGISIVWKLPFQLYEIWAFAILGLCFKSAIEGAEYFALTLAALITVSTIFELASNLEIKNSQLRIREIPEHKLHISHLITEALTVVIGFSCIFFCLSLLNPNSFNKNLNIIDSIYFSFMVGTTVGFGHIHPVSGIAKILTITEAFLGFMFVVFMVAVFLAVWVDKKGQSNDIDSTKKV